MRTKVQEALLLLEMSQNEFKNWIFSDIKAIKPHTMYKILGSLTDISSDIVEEFSDAYEQWSENGYSSYDVPGFFKTVLTKFSDTQLDEFFEKFNASPNIPDYVDKSLQERIFAEIIKRTKNIKPNIAHDLDKSLTQIFDKVNIEVDYNLLDFFRALLYYLEHKGNIDNVRNEWNNLASSVSKKTYGSKNTARAYEQLLEKIESILNQIDVEIVQIESWNVEDDIKKLLNLFNDMPKSTSFMSMFGNSTDSDTFDLVSLGLSSPKAFARKYTKEYDKQRHRSTLFIKQVTYEIKQTKDIIDQLENYKLNSKEKERLSVIISIVRILAQLDEKDQKKFPLWRLGDYVSAFVHNNPPKEITEEYVKSLTNAFVQGLIRQNSDSGVNNLENFAKQIEAQIEKEKILKDPLFLEVTSTIERLLNSASLLDNDNINQVREELYTEFVKEKKSGIRPWDDIIIMMIDGTKETDNTYYQNELIKTWMSTTEEQRIGLIDRVQRVLDPFIKIAIEKDIERKKQNPPEAPEDAPLNQYAFAKKRDGLPGEINNKHEDELYRALVRHFKDNDPVSKALANEISQFLANDQYATIFKKPTQKFIFRGMSVNENWLKTAIKSDVPPAGMKETSFTFTPKGERGITSWTISHQTAINFANNDDGYSVFLVAESENNDNKFAMGPTGLYKVKGFDSHTSEHEVIGLGEIKVSKVYWSTQKYLLKNIVYKEEGIEEEKNEL